jgi:hypothetical protein
MTGGADFDLNPGCQLGGNAKTRSEDLYNKRVTSTDQLHAAADADAQSLEPLHVFIVCGNTANHGTNPWGQFIQPHYWRRLYGRSHKINKLSLPSGMSNPPLKAVDAKTPEKQRFNRYLSVL